MPDPEDGDLHQNLRTLYCRVLMLPQHSDRCVWSGKNKDALLDCVSMDGWVALSNNWGRFRPIFKMKKYTGDYEVRKTPPDTGQWNRDGNNLQPSLWLKAVTCPNTLQPTSV